MNKPPRPFQVKVDGRPIDQYHIRRGPAAIGYSLEYELMQAWVASPLSLDEFNALPGSPIWMLPGQTLSKCHILMAYRMNKWIEAAGSEAQMREYDRKQALSRAKSKR